MFLLIPILLKKENNMQSQNDLILNHLKNYYQITPRAALNSYGIFRLAARIYDLKQQGNKIGCTIKSERKTGKRWATYYLKTEGRK